MITAWLKAALDSAQYGITETGRIFGSIPRCPGVWAEAARMELCREELSQALEGWLLLGLSLGHRLPVLNGINLHRSPKSKPVRPPAHA